MMVWWLPVYLAHHQQAEQKLQKGNKNNFGQKEAVTMLFTPQPPFHSLTPYHTTTSFKTLPITTQSRVLTTLQKKAFENIVGKEKMLVTSIFSFFHNVFYPSQNKF